MAHTPLLALETNDNALRTLIHHDIIDTGWQLSTREKPWPFLLDSQTAISPNLYVIDDT